jgi:glutamate/aspartate transport system substrate-binding protein
MLVVVREHHGWDDRRTDHRGAEKYKEPSKGNTVYIGTKSRQIHRGDTMKFLSLILVATITAVAMPVASAASRVDRIKATGEITLGFRNSSIPFSYLDDHQTPVGYSMDICHHIVDSLKKDFNLPNLKTKLMTVTQPTRIPLVANGTVDLACGSSTNTKERQAQVSFSPTTFLTSNRFTALKASNLKVLSDLKGKVVVANPGSANILWVTKVNAEQKLGMKIVPAATHSEAFLAVQNGRASAYFNDDVMLATLIAGSRSPADWMVSKEAFDLQPYAIIEPKNDEQFKAAVDNAVKTMMKDGTMAKLYAKWFAQPIPPQNINLNWPMTPALKKAFDHPTDSPDPAVYR